MQLRHALCLLPVLMVLLPSRLTALEFPRIKIADTSHDEFFALMKANTPFIITDLMPSWPPMNLSWHDQYTGGHTVNPVPQELSDLHKTQWKFPFNQTIRWFVDTAWGGEPGFGEDGSNEHVDRDCVYFVALQARGRKKWWVRKPSPGFDQLGEFFAEGERYHTIVEPQEVLLWPPWLPHATGIVTDKAFSINGRLTFMDGHKRREELTTMPKPCSGTQEEMEAFYKGDEEEEDPENTEYGEENTEYGEENTEYGEENTEYNDL